MLFRTARLAGVKLIDLEPAIDERGFFARTFCTRELAAQGLETSFVQHSVSCTLRQGSVRGMHFQRPPHEEVKLLRCIRGAMPESGSAITIVRIRALAIQPSVFGSRATNGSARWASIPNKNRKSAVGNRRPAQMP